MRVRSTPVPSKAPSAPTPPLPLFSTAPSPICISRSLPRCSTCEYRSPAPGSNSSAGRCSKREGWLTPEIADGHNTHLPAGARARLLLQWAGIPPEIPDELPALADRAAAVGQAGWERPEVLFKIRNDLLHPPRHVTDPKWPDFDQLLAAWQLGTWYLELIVLRCLGYTGEYRSRLRLGGWENHVELVPWSVPPTEL